MKRLARKITTLALAMGLMVALMPIKALANDTKDTFDNIPIEGHDANMQPIDFGRASIKLSTAKYEEIDTTVEYIVQSDGGSTKEDLGPSSSVQISIDEGYGYVQAYRIFISGITSQTLMGNSIYEATMTIPVPAGCVGNGAKRIFDWAKISGSEEHFDKYAVTNNENGTISFPITIGSLKDSITGIISLEGSIIVEYLKPIDISGLTTTATLSITSTEYTGNPIEPTVTIPGLTKDVDFTVAYSNNTEVGTGKVTITGKGLYYGSFDLSFTITPKPVIEEAKDSSGSDYKIDSNGTTYEATFTAPKTKNEKKVTVPDEITLPDGSTAKVTAIAKNAFKGNTKLTNATIGNNVKTIGDNAFNGCSKLTSLKLGNKVENIGKGAVSNCKSLKSVTVPASTKSIGKNAFKGDTNLKTLTINCKNLKSVDKDAIKNINPKATIKLKGSTKQKKAAEKLITNKKTGYKKSMKIKK